MTVAPRKPVWLHAWQTKRDAPASPPRAGLTIPLYDQQAAFIFDEARYPALVAGRNSGKTVAGAIKAANRCATPGLGIIAAPSYPMLMHAARRQFLAELDRRAAYDPRWSHVENKSDRLLSLPAFGSEVLFGSLDNPNSVRGPNADWGWLDEPGYVSDEAWRTLKGTVRAGDRPQLWPTGTPKGRNHFLFREWMVNPDADHTYHHATSLENPFVDAEAYVSGLGYDGLFRDQEVGGKFVAFDGLVYPRFDRVEHVRTIECADWQSILAVDFGLNDPSVVLTIRHGAGRFHVEREWYRTQIGSSVLVAAVKAEYARSGAQYVVYDPAGAQIARDFVNENMVTRKADHAIVPGISRVTTALPALTVDPSCTNLIREMETYRYPDNGRDVPLDRDNHGPDALRYGIMALNAGISGPIAFFVGDDDP